MVTACFRKARCARIGCTRSHLSPQPSTLEAADVDRSMQAELERGASYPLGATPCPGGVNFSLFSKHATSVQLLLFDHVDDAGPSRVIELDRHAHRTYHYWHGFLPGVGPGQLYAFRADGPWSPEKGLRFDRSKVLLD